jgi:signal transduction histidine kinase
VLQIVYNLISNACKFTEQGFIKLSIGLCDDESINGNGNVILLTSTDSSLVSIMTRVGSVFNGTA